MIGELGHWFPDPYQARGRLFFRGNPVMVRLSCCPLNLENAL